MVYTIPAGQEQQGAQSPLRVIGLARDPELDSVTRHLVFEVELNRWPTDTERRYLALDFGPQAQMGVAAHLPVANETPHLSVSLEGSENLDAAVRSLKDFVVAASTQADETDASAAGELEAVTAKLRDLLSEA